MEFFYFFNFFTFLCIQVYDMRKNLSFEISKFSENSLWKINQTPLNTFSPLCDLAGNLLLTYTYFTFNWVVIRKKQQCNFSNKKHKLLTKEKTKEPDRVKFQIYLTFFADDSLYISSTVSYLYERRAQIRWFIDWDKALSSWGLMVIKICVSRSRYFILSSKFWAFYQFYSNLTDKPILKKNWNFCLGKFGQQNLILND